jgi:hypothetical protein
MLLVAKHPFYDLEKEKKKDDELRQVNGECPSERRLMRAANR